MKKPCVIGIDPGVNTGVATWRRDIKRLIYCATLDFWEAFKYVTDSYGINDCVLYIEDASLIHYTFEQKGDGSYQDRISRNAGRIQRECELLIEGFKKLGYEVVRVKPDGKKWNDKEFRMITKWNGRTSEHARDAARFCYGI